MGSAGKQRTQMSLANVFTLALVLTIFSTAFPQSASAFYYDPGAGSLVMQVIFASWLTGMVAFVKLRKKITGFFKRLFSRKSHPADSDGS
jgi:hypothetical protein